MKTWAKIDEDNLVTEVIKIADEKENVESWLNDRFGGTWVQTFSQQDVDEGTDTVRAVNPAAIGGTYDADKKAFIFAKPFESWILGEDLIWQPPTPKPEGSFYWSEETQSWEPVDNG